MDSVGLWLPLLEKRALWRFFADLEFQSGTVDNPILDLAKQTKGTTFSPPEDATPAVYDTEGRPLNQNIANELSEIVWGLIADGFKYSSKNCASIPPEKSLMDYLKERVKANDLNEQSLKLVLLMARMWGDFVGEPIEKQSLKYFWLEECIEGGTRATSNFF